MRKRCLARTGGWLAVLVLFLGSSHCPAAVTNAAPIKLSWNAANDTAVKGYALYYGAVNQISQNRVDVGTNLTCTISNLIVGVNYLIYAVAYSATGMESVPSNELLFAPSVPLLPPAPSGPKLEITKQSNGSMKLSYKATPGLVCGIQFAATPNPAAWQTLTNVTASSISNVIALDSSANLVPKRFYRVALSAQPLVSAIKLTRLSNGYMRLDWTAPPLSSCRVTYAPNTNSTIWPTLTTVTADAEGRASAIDPAAAVVSTRFYRVVMP